MCIAVPFDPAFPVVCMDETPRQLIGETRETLPTEPGRPARHDYEYQRCGTCNVFMAAEPLAGKRMTKVTQRRTKADWARSLADIADRYPSAIRITLVMDNLSTAPPRRTVRDLPCGTGQGPVRPLRVRLHPQIRQLAEHRRDRTQRHDPSVPQSPNRFLRSAARRDRRLAGGPGSGPGQGRLAVHHRRRPCQAEAPLSDI